jgi:hypothetical protein
MTFLSGISDWCRGRSPWIRLPLLLFVGYAAGRHLQDSDYCSIVGALDLGIHELGHFLFMPGGEFLGILGGSLTQCLLPVIGMVNFWRQDDWFAIDLCFGWLALNLFETATYAADAQAMELPLLTPFGGEAIHDWNFLLDRLGILGHCGQIAGGLSIAGALMAAFCLAWGGWMLWQMWRRPGTVAQSGDPH